MNPHGGGPPGPGAWGTASEALRKLLGIVLTLLRIGV